MVVLDRDARALDMADHLAAEVVQTIVGRQGVVAAMDGHPQDRQVGRFPIRAGVPGAFHGVDVVKRVVDVALVADGVEQVVFELRGHHGVGGEAGVGQVALSPSGHATRIAADRLPRTSVEDLADHGEGGLVPEGIHEARARIGEDEHVAGLAARESGDARTIEGHPLAEDLLVEPRSRQGDVAPAAEQSAELQVDLADLVAIGHLEYPGNGIVHGGLVRTCEHRCFLPSSATLARTVS